MSVQGDKGKFMNVSEDGGGKETCLGFSLKIEEDGSDWSEVVLHTKKNFHGPKEART
jgi:hypothetical protein